MRIVLFLSRHFQNSEVKKKIVNLQWELTHFSVTSVDTSQLRPALDLICRRCHTLGSAGSERDAMCSAPLLLVLVTCCAWGPLVVRGAMQDMTYYYDPHVIPHPAALPAWNYTIMRVETDGPTGARFW